MKTQQFVVYRIAEFGVMAVYRRGDWYKKERLPKYLVSSLVTGRDLEEFRRKASAIKWAQSNQRG
jgi:hypothetical protein